MPYATVQPAQPLSRREVVVIAGLARGDGYAQIGRRLGGLSPITVKKISRRAEVKLGAENPPSLVDAAYRSGVLAGLPPVRVRPVVLSADQRLLLGAIAAGRTYAEIGAVWGVSASRVNNRCQRLRQLLGVGTRAELVAVGWQLGLLGGDPPKLPAGFESERFPPLPKSITPPAPQPPAVALPVPPDEAQTMPTENPAPTGIGR